MKRFAIVAAVALALSACSSSGVNSAGTVANTVTVTSAKTLTEAELAYNTAANAAYLAVKQGYIKGETAARLRQLNSSATSALITGYGAQTTAEQLAAVASLNSITDAIRALTPIGAN